MASITPKIQIQIQIQILGTSVEANKGRNWDIGTYGKHQTKTLNFPVHQDRPTGVKKWDTRTHGKRQTKNLKFLVRH